MAKPGLKSERPTHTNTLGDLIRQTRIDKGLSLSEVASKIQTRNGKMAKSYLSRIEENQKSPSTVVAAQIAEALEIPFSKIQHLIIVKKLEDFSAPSSQNQKPIIKEKYIVVKDSQKKLFDLPSNVLAELKRQLKEEEKKKK